MKLTSLTICLLITSLSYGHETVLKEKNGESYYVLKENPGIKHGSYQYSTNVGLMEKGQYDHDKRTGVWEFYDADNASLEQKYNYTSRELVFNKTTKPFGDCRMIVDGKPTGIVPDTPPIFIGGRSRYDRYLKDNLKYPSDSKAKEIEGRQLIMVSLSGTGAILNITARRPIAPDIDAEALRLIGALPKEWIPAVYQKKNVDAVIAMPVLFELE